MKRRLIAINAKAKAAIAIASNDRPFTKDGEWQLISPYGIFAHHLGRQDFHKREAEEVVAALNSARSKAGNDWRGYPIFIGHPPSRGGQPSTNTFPRIGGVMEAEARDDGLWGKVAKNSKGEENAREGFFIYPSPGWFFHDEGNGVIRPCELDHIGMTNEPNILGSAPWTNEAPNEETNDNPNQQEKMKLIAQKLGLAEDATEEQILAKITDLLSQAETEKAKAAESKTAADTEKTAAINERNAKEQVEDELKKARKAHADTLLTVAVNEGKITVAERVQHEQAFEKDFAVATNELSKLQPKHNTKAVSLEFGGARRSIATAGERRDALQAAVNERMKADGVEYGAAYSAVQKDPKFKPLFDAMAQPKLEA